MKRILIVSGAALSRNPRVVKEAGALAESGHAVTVLTLRNHPAAEEHDRELLAGARFSRITLDVAPVPGAPVLPVFWRRARSSLARRLARWTGRSSIETIGPGGELLRVARRQTADLVIGHTELGLWVAAQLLAEGRKIAADFEDWHSEDLPPADRVGRPVRLLAEVERALLRDASYTTTTSLALARALHQQGGGKEPAVVTNSFPLQPDFRPGSPGSRPAFFWFSQTLGPGRGLEEFLAAWQMTKAPGRLVVLGEDRAGYRESLLATLPSSRRTAVQFLDLVPPARLPSLIAQHDVGLALESSATRSRDLTITNKILQYLNAGLAVVATPTAGQREVLSHDATAGLLVDFRAPAAAARQLDILIGERAALAASQRAARRLAETVYCWEKEAPKLLSLVGAALQS